MLAILMALLCACACGDDEAPWPDFGFRRDLGRTFNDLGRHDFAQAPRDGRADVGARDDGNPGGCQTAQASCSAACKQDELCTEASGGTCTKVSGLAGKADSKAVLSAIALAYARCWALQASSDALCTTFDSCALEGDLTAAAVRSWICDKAQIVDFPTKQDHDDARAAVGCELWQVQRVEWTVGTIAPKQRAMICIGYDYRSLILDDTLPVTACKDYPYP